PVAYGGTEAVLDSLARGLADVGHDVLLFTTGDSTCPVLRVSVFEQSLGVGTATAGAASELRHVIAAYEIVADYDVVHDHTLVGPVYADRLPWLPVITTNHAPFASDLGPLYQAVRDRVPVIAISHHQAAAAHDVNLAGVIHHGVDTDRFPVGKGDGGYALFLGRMNPDKGVHLAIEIAREAGVPLRIAAKMREKVEQDYFDDYVSPLLGGDIEYLGEVAADDKLELLGAAKCLLNPIQWPEPFGMVMIEALATGTPVVATPAGAAPEIVTSAVTGFLAPDDDGLVEAVRRIDEIDRHACRREVEARFSARRMVDEHVRAYEKVIEERRRVVFGADPDAVTGASSLRPT
ncbi:MAG TPA: glycosyltransferase family 4 protein, partial [Acidimicrobiales bacterium]|nr:glycosyltransferase family 4 protein [Acidimicrobiales bacterium]